MSMPPLLLGAALLFWGWQTGNLPAAVPLAAIIEAPRWVRLRFELRPLDYNRIADLCTYVFVGLAALLVANNGVSRGVLLAFQWLPAALAPVLLAQMLGASGRINLSALFRYLRRMKARDASVKDPAIDVSGAYLAITAIAAGAANNRGYGYYAGIVLLAAWALWTWRPRHAPLLAGGALFAIAAGAGFAAHLGLAQLQGSLEAWFADWRLRAPEDPFRSVSDIGSIGRLKQLDTILLRVYASGPQRQSQSIGLLHRASYNVYSGTTWVARNAALVPVEPQPDGTSWVLAAAPPGARVRIATRFESGKALLALPPGTVRLAELPAAFVRRNALGAVQAEMPANAGGDWLRYAAEHGERIGDYAPPTTEDTQLPALERQAFEALAQELGLRALPAAEVVRRVHEHLRGFSYSLYREHAPRRDVSPLTDFLTHTKAGHCEYFAAAAALLLRAAGIPARYATGFAVLEHSALEGAYLVRARHAHAWTRVFVDGGWIDVDTTPPAWFEEEASQAPIWEKLVDLARWAGFRWSQREQGSVAGGAWWWVLGALAAVLAWRLLRGRRAVRGGKAREAGVARYFAGADSEFFGVERALSARFGARQRGEPAAAWAARIAPLLDDGARDRLAEALGLHQRYRFDPLGLSAAQRGVLRSRCAELLAPPGSASAAGVKR